MEKVRSILRWLFIAMIITIILLWLWAGGWTLIKREVRALPNPLDILFGTSTSTYKITLPWAVAIPQGPDISGLAEEGDALSGGDENESVQPTDTSRRAQALQSGIASPYRGIVVLAGGNARESDADTEFVDLHNRGGSSVVISGWTLESMLSGRRAFLPKAAQPLIAGAINRVGDVVLAPGEEAFVTSGLSPAGASFRENLCTGYLSQVQLYDPPLQNACPSPDEHMLETIGGDRIYGADCYAYMRSIPRCDYPTNVPSSLSLSCQTLIADEFSYNGCVRDNQRRTDFNLPVWRLYAGSGIELWNNQHDIIRLLDSAGRVVDANITAREYDQQKDPGRNGHIE